MPCDPDNVKSGRGTNFLDAYIRSGDRFGDVTIV